MFYFVDFDKNHLLIEFLFHFLKKTEFVVINEFIESSKVTFSKIYQDTLDLMLFSFSFTTELLNSPGDGETKIIARIINMFN